MVALLDGETYGRAIGGRALGLMPLFFCLAERPQSAPRLCVFVRAYVCDDVQLLPNYAQLLLNCTKKLAKLNIEYYNVRRT